MGASNVGTLPCVVCPQNDSRQRAAFAYLSHSQHFVSTFDLAKQHVEFEVSSFEMNSVNLSLEIHPG